MKSVLFLLVVAAGLAAVRVFLMSGADLFPDEALYAWLGHSAPFNFCPHPPGVPLITRAGTELLGQHEFGARFVSLLLSTLILVPLYLLARDIGGESAARWSVVAYACTPFFVAFGAITTPDGPQLFCFVVALYFTLKALQENKAAWWIATGVALALGLYFKYIIVLYFPSLFLALLLVPQWRKYLKTAGPYLPGLLVLVLFVGVAGWRDSQSDWAALRYHLRDRQALSGFSPKGAAVYHGIHLGYYSPLLYGIAVWVMFRSLVGGWRQADSRLLFLAAFSIVPWFFFALIALATERDLSREQWDACAYIPAYIAAAMLLPRAGRFKLRTLAPILGAITLLILTIEIRTMAITRMIDRDPLFTKISGWRALGAGLERHIAEHYVDGPPPFIVADSFAPALEASFYTANKYPVFSLPADRNSRYGLNELLEQTGVSLGHLERLKGQNGLVLIEDKGKRGTVTSETEVLNSMFQKVEELKRIAAFRKNRQIRVFRVFKGTGLTDTQAEVWQRLADD